MARQKLTLKEMQNLRVGDVVRIHMYHYGDEPLGVPFEVALTRVHYNAIWDHKGRCRPQIEWSPRPGIDQITIGMETRAEAFCDASFVTKVVRKAPVDFAPVVRNELALEDRRTGVYSDTQRSKTCVAATPVSVARYILSRMPHLDIPRGINEKRIAAFWEKDGRPGLKGFYSYSQDRAVKTERRPDRSGGFTFGDLNVTWIHVEQFKRWLLRRLPYLITTVREMERDARAAHEAEQRDWDDDRFSDREFASDEYSYAKEPGGVPLGHPLSEYA